MAICELTAAKVKTVLMLVAVRMGLRLRWCVPVPVHSKPRRMSSVHAAGLRAGVCMLGFSAGGPPALQVYAALLLQVWQD